MAASSITELQVFSGGLRLKPAAHLIEQTESRYSANHELRRGNLTPFLAPLFYEPAAAEYFFYFDNKFQYYDKWRSNTIYDDVWYSSDSLGTYKRKRGEAADNQLGIEPPIDAPIVGIPIAPVNGDGLEGNINYVYTYYDPESGSESPPSPPSITTDLTGSLANQALPVSGLIGTPTKMQTKLYRIGSTGITAYSAVETLASDVTEYTDELKFSQIEGNILDTLRAYPPPTGLLLLTQHLGRFFGSVGSRLYFSALGKPDSWFELDFIGFDEAITGIVSVANGLVVMSSDKSWLLSGSTPRQFRRNVLSANEGCVNARSIAVNNGMAIWLSGSGFILSNGSKADNISLGKLGRFNALEPFGAAIIDQRYFMSFGGILVPGNSLLPDDELYPASVVDDAGLKMPPGAITIDFDNKGFAFSTIIDSDMKSLLVARNELFQISKSSQERLNRVTEDGLANRITESSFFNRIALDEPETSLSEVLNGSEYRELHYTSPLLTEGSIGSLKQYEKVRITYTGKVHLKIIDENLNVFVETDISSLRKTNEWIYIPIGFNRGYGIQFILTGKCVVDSILYNWTPREAQ